MVDLIMYCGLISLSKKSFYHNQRKQFMAKCKKLLAQTFLYKSELKELKYTLDALKINKQSDIYFNVKGRVSHIGLLCKTSTYLTRYIRIIDLIGREIDIILWNHHAISLNFNLDSQIELINACFENNTKYIVINLYSNLNSKIVVYSKLYSQ